MDDRINDLTAEFPWLAQEAREFFDGRLPQIGPSILARFVAGLTEPDKAMALIEAIRPALRTFIRREVSEAIADHEQGAL